MQTVIIVATDFTRTPGGRYRRDGDWSGEDFRERFLLQPLGAGQRVRVVLDGTAGYATSFLEEAFGGTVRQLHKSISGLVDVVTENASRKREVTSYIAEAERRLA